MSVPWLAGLVPVRNVDGNKEKEHAEDKVDHGAHACWLARSPTRRYTRLVPAARAGGTSITRIVESALPLTRWRELGAKARQVGGKSCVFTTRSTGLSVSAWSTVMLRSELAQASSRPSGLTASTVAGRADTLRVEIISQVSAFHTVM